MHQPKRNVPSRGKSRSAQPKTGSTKKKVGSNPEAAESIGGKGDFGVAAGDPAHRTERLIASDETKHRDKNLGGHEPRSGAAGTRTSGAGGPDSGPGSSSGGDLDTDIVGVGTGGSGVSQSGPTGRTTGPDITEGEPIGEPLKHHGDKQEDQIPRQRPRARAGNKHEKRQIVKGSTIDREGDATTQGEGQGADATTNPSVRGDDSFAGEISGGEASGQDNSPADRM